MLIAVDWGTSACRAALIDASGTVQKRAASDAGIMQIAPGDFSKTLTALTSSWQPSGKPYPVLLSGMVGSKQGWREALYVPTPANAANLAANLLSVSDGCWIVPGVMTRDAQGIPDVMRGEETQLVGAGLMDGWAVLPGTHSKWVELRGGAIVGFRTLMTGEVFAALKDHTILGRLMVPKEHAEVSNAAFNRGFDYGYASAENLSGALLSKLFSVRSLALFGELAPPEIADYLSGLLLGSECAEMRRRVPLGTSLTLIGSAALTARYAHACACAGWQTTQAAPDAAVHGAYTIARAAGLL